MIRRPAELAVVVVVVAVLIAIALPVLRRARCGAAMTLDKGHLRSLHVGLTTHAAGDEGWLPLPSRIAGAGPATNHSAALYSSLVMNGYAAPEVLVAHRCTENNRGVAARTDYDFTALDPARGRFWDERFTMRIDDPDVGANGSFCHMALCGERLGDWRETTGYEVPLMCTRGPKDGIEQGPAYARSPTLRMYGRGGAWAGLVLYGDGHAEGTDSFHPDVVTHETAPGLFEPDNILVAEFDHPLGSQAGADAFLCICIEASENTVRAVHDPLD